MQDDLTEIWMILDRSGSMGSIHSATVEAFNTFIVNQQKESGRAVFTLRQFDHEVLVTHDRIPLSEVTPLTLADFEPRGCTALYDAVGQAIDDLGKRLADTPEADRPGQVVMAVLTDGMENASSTYSGKDVADRIQHQRETYGWDILFMGSDFDVEQVADNLKIHKASRKSFKKSSAGVKEAMQDLHQMVSESRQKRYRGN